MEVNSENKPSFGGTVAFFLSEFSVGVLFWNIFLALKVPDLIFPTLFLTNGVAYLGFLALKNHRRNHPHPIGLDKLFEDPKNKAE